MIHLQPHVQLTVFPDDCQRYGLTALGLFAIQTSYWFSRRLLQVCISYWGYSDFAGRFNQLSWMFEIRRFFAFSHIFSPRAIESR